MDNYVISNMEEKWKEEIVREVLKRLQMSHYFTGLQQVETKIKNEIGLFIENGTKHEVGYFEVVYSKTFSVKTFNFAEMNYPLVITEEILSNLSEIFVVGLSLKSLAAIANGLRDSRFTDLIAQSILGGKKITVLSGEKVPLRCPLSYRQLIGAQVEKVKSFGVVFDLDFSISPLNTRDYPFRTKLISLRDLEQIPSGTKLELTKGTLITALARDEAKNRGIEICEVSAFVSS